MLMPDVKWKPIAPLTAEEREINRATMRPLYETWHAARERLVKSSAENFRIFSQRLIRRLSIETGILERLYDLDRGTTEALVANGFAEELVTRTNTDIEPSRLIDLLRDQEAAIQLVMDCVAGKRNLSKGVIHELHSILTQHQDTTLAVDQFGNRLEIPLLKGRYKKQENNPKRPDGIIHEYCPPVHVDAQMENLLTLLHEYKDDDPILVFSWFHHRFTQIHPYQDGNGRVTRALTTLILLRANLLPLVIDRDLRVEYIKALESADFGDIKPLTSIFSRLQQAAILQALSVDADVEAAQEGRLTTAVIESLSARFNRRRREKDTQLRKVNDVAFELRSRARNVIQGAVNALAGPVSQLARPKIYVGDGGSDHDNAHWYKFEIVNFGNEVGKYVNFDEIHYFVKATIRVDRERLIFVTSLHHIGRELSGIMEATAFCGLEAYEDSEDRERVSQDFFPCSLEPFVFAYQTDIEELGQAFDQWLDAAIAVAFKEFGDRL